MREGSGWVDMMVSFELVASEWWKRKRGKGESEGREGEWGWAPHRGLENEKGRRVGAEFHTPRASVREIEEKEKYGEEDETRGNDEDNAEEVWLSFWVSEQRHQLRISSALETRHTL